ncbi:MAG: hypothetical protein ACHP82_00255 [Hyphomicrobiales bacterium]
MQPTLSVQFRHYLDQLVELGYGKTPTEAAQYLIDRGIDDLVRTRTIGPHFKPPRKRK